MSKMRKKEEIDKETDIRKIPFIDAGSVECRGE